MKQNITFKFLLLLITGVAFSGIILAQSWNPNYSVGTNTGNYNFSYNQVPAPLVEIYPAAPPAGCTYQWQQSFSPLFDNPVNLSTTAIYTFPAGTHLTQNTYFRRITTNSSIGSPVTSNIIKLQLVSVNWEDINYVREHDVLTTGTTDWKVIDQMAIGTGQKLQSTTYLDGLGRSAEKISKATATPASGSTTWGDIVQFSVYDAYGRQPQQFLPYTTTNQPGIYKTSTATDQPNYYTATYNETSAYLNITYDYSPLSRVNNIKSPGTSWAAGAGNSSKYDLNTLADNVQIFTIEYTSGSIPVSNGAYPANSLYKITHIDEKGNQVIEYTNFSGQLILTKQQATAAPTDAYNGWICTYSVYDDFGLLRYHIQPEGVKYLNAHGWSFAGTDGTQVLNEQCFRYEYDSKGRTILKKAPGAKLLQMIYDSRDRVVFMQDGNQAALTTPQWTANLYDELDRLTITTLYNTTETVAALQTDINNASGNSTVTVTNAGAPILDLVVDNRVAGVGVYAAQNSVSFVSDAGGSFSSAPGDMFTTSVGGSATGSSVTTTSTVYSNPVSSSNLGNASVCTVLKYLFYDDYTYAGAKSFDVAFNNTQAYSTSDANVIPIASSKRTNSYPTGSMIRVLGSNTFLTSSEYYDEKGRHIQTLEDNIKQGQDVTTLQYHWDGRLLSTYEKHSTPNSGYSGFGILSKNLFDNIGRVTSIQKQYGSNTLKTLVSYDYDDVGRLKTKHLDPGYTGSGKTEMESLAYSYNIHNNIIGINKDYALKTTGTYNKWGNFFGLYLGYDNRDNIFTTGLLDGHIAGTLWTTQGDDAQRKYDYTYDNAGRLASASFNEKQTPGDTWSNAKMDFSVNGTGGKITYDLNGNLLSMIQKGVLAGNASPVTVDNLVYTYQSYSNKLSSVVDNGTLGSANGQLGDFKDGANATGTADYVYDNNGNLVVDLNKAIGTVNTPGITYNFLDKPVQVVAAGKGTINIVYDADGNKLQKTYTPLTGTAITTTYINQFVYQGNTLQYINFEEGRIRIIQPFAQSNGLDATTISGNITLPNSQSGVFDYYIRDYQQNVRMILTEEVHTGSNQCTMETSRQQTEDAIFQGSGSEVENTRAAISTIPGQTTGAGWHSNTSSSVSQLGNYTGGLKTGPNVLLKVMAGDIVNATTQYYYASPVTNGTGTTGLTQNVVNSLIGAISTNGTVNSVIHGNTSGIASQLNSSGNTAFMTITEPDASNAAGTSPKAYLTVMFFDERFNYVGTGSAVQRVSQAGDGASPLVLANIQAPKNGYAYVYVSNESVQPVYFDNMQVGLNHGRIIEEDHYYAYGLKITALSSKVIPDTHEGFIDNKNLYNDKKLEDEGDLNWYDYGFRSYDAQIGKFVQLDPLTDNYSELTPYQFAGNEPLANVDLDGLEPVVVTNAGEAAISGYYNVVVKSSKVVQTAETSEKTAWSLHLAAVGLKGTKDALLNAHSLGIHDAIWGTGLSDYITAEEKTAYLHGRINGNAGAIAMGISETEIGSGTAVTTGGVTLGVGAAVGAGVALHGVGISAVATGDIAWSTRKLYEINAAGQIVYSTSVSEKINTNGETQSTKIGKEAHDNYNPGAGYETRRSFNRLKNGKIPDAVDYINKIVRELKPNNSRAFKRGLNQVEKYATQLSKQYGEEFKTVVDTYEKAENGIINYFFGTPK